jgi:soluble lytic murein transglycosylase-like protein
VAGHRTPRGRTQPAVPVRDRASHRAPSDGHRRVQVVATAATLGAVAAGAVTALLPGSSASADPVPAAAATDAAPPSVLAASAGVLQPAERIRTLAAPAQMLPVAYSVEDEAAEQRVASVQKASRLAEQLAALHAQQARTQSQIRAGGLDGWIAEALQVMGMPQSLAPGIKKIILAESGGNPHAVNTWDSNAVRGTPSRGLMQTIPSTFRAYVHPELAGRPITDPVANITAGVRYMVDRYGMKTVVAGGRSDGAGGYLGY